MALGTSAGTAGVAESGGRPTGLIARNVQALGGLFLLAGVVAGAVSLATWSINDPSLTYANGGEARNALGFWGASFADIAMQFFGLVAALLLVPPAVWGWMKFSGHMIGQMKLRIAAWIAGSVFAGGAIGAITAPDTWPLPLGLGGVAGDALLGIPATFLGAYPSGLGAVVAGLFFGVIALPLYGIALALLLRSPAPAAAPKPQAAPEYADEDEDDDHVSLASRLFAPLALPIGLLFHWFYLVKGLISRSLPARKRRPQDDPHIAMRAAQDEFIAHEPVGGPAAAGGVPVEPQFDRSPLDHDDVPPFDHEDPAADWSEVPPVEIEPRVASQASPGGPAAAPRVQPQAPKPKTGSRIVREAQQPLFGHDTFELPTLHLLTEPKNVVRDASMSNEALEQNARLLEGVLSDFGVRGEIIKVRPGPVVTLYELEPAPGIKSSRVIGLADDIARSMSAIAARVAVVPGRNAIGIELPNTKRETVFLREMLASQDFESSKGKLALCLGKNIGGEPVIADLAKMPHLLVAGTTGSGKSVAINTMILSLLYKHDPQKCKMIMIDPKMLELSIYDGIPHLLTPVVTDPKKAVVALKWTVREMEERYRKMSKLGVRNIDGFNTRVEQAAKKGEVLTRTVQTGFDKETGEAIYEHEELDLEPMPYIVVIIDEMADLMMVAGKDIEGTVQRLAQMARAAGIHVIMATQRPSVDVITGTIKANFPTRISFQVTSKIDSRTILGEMGAEQLLGMGDMLYMAGGGRITRVHGPFVADNEVEDVVKHLQVQGVPQYLEEVTEELEDEVSDGGGGSGASGDMGDSDDPYDQAVAIVLRDRKASTSYIQRRLSIGYNRAASLIERMEQEGLISPANHAGKRDILVPAEDETI
ncbi:MAG: DNA translocase FtsK [Pseudomonadota bacterium]